MGTPVRQWPNQHPFNDAENGGVRANPERERKHSDGGEPRVLAQLPRRETKVLNQILQPAHPTLFATSLFNGFHPAELAHSCIARLVCGHARFDVLSYPHLDMRTHLFSHVRVELLLLEQRAESK